MDTSAANGHRQTATLKYEISTTWGRKPRTTSQGISRLLMGTEQATRPKNLKAMVMIFLCMHPSQYRLERHS